MSDHRALAAVTVTLKHLLTEWVANDLGTTPTVTPTRPDTTAATTTPTLSVFLYHVAPNAYARNNELPTRRGDATRAGRSSLALDLSFLITAYGGESSWTPQVVMGSALRALHTCPVLTREFITSALTVEVDGSSTHPLAGADLANQVELIRLSPLSLNLEELTKLWSVMLQTPYALSSAWQASVVFLDSVALPSSNRPVRTVNLLAIPKSVILVDSVESSLGKDEPITRSTLLHLRGRNLKGDSTWLRVLGTDYAATSVSPKLITFDLSTVPAADLRSGILGISIVHHPLDTDGDRLLFGYESNAVGFALRPTISPPATGSASGAISIGVVPDLTPNQRVVLFLNLLSGTTSYAIEAPVSVVAPAETTSTVTVDLSPYDITPGTYLVRLQVDGAQSVLVTDSADAYIGPTTALS